MDLNLNSNLIKKNLLESYKLIERYHWLIDAHVLDFYVDDHWTQLPNSWKLLFKSVQPENLPEILNENNSSNLTTIWPLSILCLKVLKQKLCIKRSCVKENLKELINKEKDLTENPKLKFFFTKCIKQKKRHEINKMSKICFENASNLNIKYIVDFGAGLGHLSRILSFNYGLKVCCFEMQNELNVQARVIDEQLQNAIGKYVLESKFTQYTAPIHITCTITEHITPGEFLEKIKCAFQISKNCKNFTFGIVGLHPCGNLAAILINIFLKIKEAKFLNLVGCCYMKLNDYGYPLSNFSKTLKLNNLSYTSKEIACHAIETYTKRLENNNYFELKIHHYRAALEKIIVNFSTKYKHSGLKSIKITNSNNFTFSEYCKKAITCLPIEIPLDNFDLDAIDSNSNWKLIVIFYTLRLFFAPLIESIILYDRILYLMENDSKVHIEAVFDPFISSRNHITTAIKK